MIFDAQPRQCARSASGRPCGLHGLHGRVPQMAHAALAQLAHMDDCYPEGIERDGKRHGMKIPVADDELRLSIDQRIVVLIRTSG